MSSLNSDDTNNGDHLSSNNSNNNNSNTLDSNCGIAEVCDVPEEVANQKRHVSDCVHVCVISS